MKSISTLKGLEKVGGYWRKERYYTIFKDADGHFLAIEDKYIYRRRLTQTLCIHDVCMSNSLKKTVALLDYQIEYEYLISTGKTPSEAFTKLYDVALVTADALLN